MRDAHDWEDQVAAIRDGQQVSEADYWATDREKDKALVNCAHEDSEPIYPVENLVPIGWVCHTCGLRKGLA